MKFMKVALPKTIRVISPAWVLKNFSKIKHLDSRYFSQKGNFLFYNNKTFPMSTNIDRYKSEGRSLNKLDILTESVGRPLALPE